MVNIIFNRASFQNSDSEILASQFIYLHSFLEQNASEAGVTPFTSVYMEA
jgi:hypothetical protein